MSVLQLVVEGSRSILFDLHSRIGLDFGILIAWGAVNTIFFPICCWFQRKYRLCASVLLNVNLHVNRLENEEERSRVLAHGVIC